MGSYRSQPEKTKFTSQKSHETMQSCISHMCGWRLYMEDFSIQQFNFDQKNNHIFGVFDGHGGPEVAAFVQRNFIVQLLKNQNFKNETYELALTQTFQTMDTILKTREGKEKIKNIQKEMKLKDNISQTQLKIQAGCTAIVCLITDKFIYIANAGDSRAIGKVNNITVCLTEDHIPQKQSQRIRIKKAGGFINQGRINGCLNVSRSIGDLDFKKNKSKSRKQQIIIATPDITKIKRDDISMLILGCDGIWEEKSSQEILTYVQEGLTAQKKLGEIVQGLFESMICKQQQMDIKWGGKDNMSAVVVVFKKARQNSTQQR